MTKEDTCSELTKTWRSWRVSSTSKFNELKLFDMSFGVKYQMAQIDSCQILRNIRFPAGWCILCLLCGSKSAVYLQSPTFFRQNKVLSQGSQVIKIMCWLLPLIWATTQSLFSQQAGVQMSACIIFPFFPPRKLLSSASLECQPCKNRRTRDCLCSTVTQGEKKQFSTSSEVWWHV